MLFLHMKSQILPVYDIENFRFIGNDREFYANTFPAHIKQHHNLVLTPHRHNFYLCVFFTKGSGIHEIDFNTYDIVPGTVFTLSPGQVHNWKFSEDTNGYIFFHTREFFNINFTFEKIEHFPFFSINNFPVIHVNNIAAAKIERLCHEIVEEYENNEELYKPQKLYKLVNLVYIELIRLYIPKQIRTEQNHNYLGKVRKLEDLIDAHFRKAKYPKEYAEMMNISDKHLNRMSKETLNKTTSELILDRIILEAKRLILFSKYSVSEISSELGYFDNSYFSRLFKKKTGATPLEFLNKYRKD
ncbi:MAG: transcriptional regulator, AraC family [Segetibacter sp.]|nr:transcriptional regulator, AraC family [Segetibacter sp.]